jgi:hypothetical protein
MCDGYYTTFKTDFQSKNHGPPGVDQRYLTLIDGGLVYTATFQHMGEILRLQRH